MDSEGLGLTLEDDADELDRDVYGGFYNEIEHGGVPSSTALRLFTSVMMLLDKVRKKSTFLSSG